MSSNESIKSSDDAPVNQEEGLDTKELMEKRIKQQSELISLMKSRNDAMILQLAKQENSIKELEDSKRQSDLILAKKDNTIAELENARRESDSTKACVQQDYETLIERFQILNHNHEELIKIKDEYKHKLKLLTSQNQFPSCPTNTDETKTLIDQKKEDQEALIAIQREKSTLQRKLDQMEIKLSDESSVVESATLEITSLKAQLSEKDSQLSDFKKYDMEKTQLLSKCREECVHLKEKMEQMKVELKSKENSLESEKGNNESLTIKIYQLEEELSKIRVNATMLSNDTSVQLLQSELMATKTKLRKTEKEFAAYEEFTRKKLQEEKALNETLRHLAF